jgi:predicted CopG family antitoxin
MVKIIAIADEAYLLLRKAARLDKSFSKVIKRGLEGTSKLSDIVGSKMISTEDWKKVKAKIKKTESVTIFKLAGSFLDTF